MTDATPNHATPDAPPPPERDAVPDPASPASRPPSSADVRPPRPDYKGSELDPERGPGLGCFWFQVIVLALFIVLIPIGLNLGWPFELLAFLLFVVIGLLLLTGQTVIFLLRLVAADRRAQGRRRPLASQTKTVGELEDHHRVVDATGGARPAARDATRARGPAPEPPTPAPGAAPPALGGEVITDRESIIGDLPGEPPGLTPYEATLTGAATDEARIISSRASAKEAPEQADEAYESAEGTREPVADDPGGKPGHDSSTLGQRSLWADDDGRTGGAAVDAASPQASGGGASPADSADANADADADAPGPAGRDDTAEEPHPGVRQ